jgi:hypothetical protein
MGRCCTLRQALLEVLFEYLLGLGDRVLSRVEKALEAWTVRKREQRFIAFDAHDSWIVHEVPSWHDAGLWIQSCALHQRIAGILLNPATMAARMSGKQQPTAESGAA